MRILVAIGFIVSAIGFSCGVFFGAREIGAAIFMFGFLMAAVGIVGATLKMNTLIEGRGTGIGVKVASIGFLLFTVGLVAEFVDLAVPVFKAIRIVGLVVMFAGVLVAIVVIGRDQKPK